MRHKKARKPPRASTGIVYCTHVEPWTRYDWCAGVDEALVLIMAMSSSNMPKFLLDDAVLFAAIVSDLFPGLDVPEKVSFLCRMIRLDETS